MMKVLAIIPARSGSKGIPHKNVSICGGKLLIHWTMEAAKKSKRITRTIISTDSPVYRELLRRHGNDLFPFMRPESLAMDTTPSSDVIISVGYITASLPIAGTGFIKSYTPTGTTIIIDINRYQYGTLVMYTGPDMQTPIYPAQTITYLPDGTTADTIPTQPVIFFIGDDGSPNLYRMV